MSSPKNRANRARAAAEHRTAASAPPRRSLLPFAVVAVVAIIAIGVAVLLSSGDDGGSDGEALATAGITVRGDPLPELPASGDDPAVGMPAPTLEGVSPDGTPIDVDFEGDEPTLLAFLAHWCPHCQAELPNLVTMAEQGQLDDVRPIIVLTGTDENQPNYPPAPWIEREGWTGPTILDDERYQAGGAYGLSGYPYLVLVDAEGDVLARSSGELGLEGLVAFVERAG
ncbi:MAG TPA: TlpA disulfide reductase family protein [Acidimicrobiales bacterium]|nr:TlpA disulfide reductase family protein [Acidimicrobiales bacterium]